MKSKKIIIGTRGSKLALIYAERAKAELKKLLKDTEIEIKKITTKGDIIQDVRLSDTGGKGLFCKLIDMTVMRHNTIPREQCKLHHDNCTADWITHMVQEYPKPFYNSDIILIERQPPQGHKDVEQIIALLFRDKIKLISPNSMHAYFGIGHLDYDQIQSAYICRHAHLGSSRT